jgi:uncharacterized protein (DUF924 family)
MTGHDEHQGPRTPGVRPESPATKSLPEAIIEYWFGTEPFDDATYRRRGALWFNGSAAVDLEITERFTEPLELAAAGRFDDWSATPTGTLAWTILVDQFPRHVYRGTPRAFAYDELGRKWCYRALEAGVERQLGIVERTFLYLPLQHSEAIDDQRRCVELFEQVLAEAPAGHWFHPHARHGVDMARLHARLIERYGRFPHRNAVLGRPSTMLEHMYLEAGGSDFGQRKLEEPPPVSEHGAKFVIHRAGLDPDDVLFVDGRLPGFRCLSHWPGAEVPAELSHPTSTGIALRYVALDESRQRELLGSFSRVTNDHYDTDGVLAACVLVLPRAAARHEELLLRAAATGDFRTWNGPDALALELTIWAVRDSPRSPLAGALAPLRDDASARDELAYRWCIDHFEELTADPFRFRSLWGSEHERVLADIERVDAGAGVSVELHAAVDLAVIRLERPLCRIATTYAARGHDRMLVVAPGEGGFHYRFAYRNESWFLGSRDRVPRRIPLDAAVAELAAMERSSEGRWWCTSIEEPTPQLGFGDPAAAAHVFADLRPDLDPATGLPPEELVNLLQRMLRG